MHFCASVAYANSPRLTVFAARKKSNDEVISQRTPD